MSAQDRSIFLPNNGEKLLDWYQGIFDGVYVALHPFYRIEGLKPGDCPAAVPVHRREELPDVLNQHTIMEFYAEYKAKFPVDLDTEQRRQKLEGKLLKWGPLVKICNLGSLAMMNRALLTSIMALSASYQSSEGCERLTNLCAEADFFMPYHNFIPPILENQVASLLERLNLTSIIVSDELDEELDEVNVDQLRTDLPWTQAGVISSRPIKIYDAAHTFLLIAPYDAFYTLICGGRQRLTEAGVEEFFEGFWCDANTGTDWWRQ